MKPVLIFDVNETLLRVDVLQPAFETLFGSPYAWKEWFDAVVLSSQTATLIDDYRDFSILAEQALEMLASAKMVSLTATDKDAILRAMGSLPAYPEVPAALRRLRSSGFRLAALTNSAQSAADAQLKNAGLHDLFERVLSVDAVGKFKPAPEVYAYAGGKLNVSPGDMLLIAVHPWDVEGAMHAGLRSAFLQRPGKSWVRKDVTPECIAPDLAVMTESLLLIN